MCFTSARTAPSASDACLRPLVPTLAAGVPPQHVHAARTAGQLSADLRAVECITLVQRSDDQLRSDKQRESAPYCSHKLLGTLLRLTVLWSASPCASAALLLASRRLHSCATSATILSSRRSTSSLSDAVSARGDGSPAPTTTIESQQKSVSAAAVAGLWLRTAHGRQRLRLRLFQDQLQPSDSESRASNCCWQRSGYRFVKGGADTPPLRRGNHLQRLEPRAGWLRPTLRR